MLCAMHSGTSSAHDGHGISVIAVDVADCPHAADANSMDIGTNFHDVCGLTHEGEFLHVPLEVPQRFRQELLHDVLTHSDLPFS